MTFDQLKKAVGVRAKNTGMGMGKAISGAVKGAMIGAMASATPKKVQAAPLKPAKPAKPATIADKFSERAKTISKINAEIEAQNRR